MSRFLDLTVIDRDSALPLDIGIAFGPSKGEWRAGIAASGVRLTAYITENDPAAIAGVQGWMTRDQANVEKLVAYLREMGDIDPERASKIEKAFLNWRCRNLVFVFHLV
jgi:hypothetical protein